MAFEIIKLTYLLTYLLTSLFFSIVLLFLTLYPYMRLFVCLQDVGHGGTSDTDHAQQL